MNEDPVAQRNSILVIDDTTANIEVLHAMLSPDYEVLFATSGLQGLELAHTSNPDLILLDVRMPGMDGLEVCRQLKSDPETRNIPVIFLTALNDEGFEETGLQAGAIDYITKPYNQAVVRRRLANHLSLKRYQDMLENLVWLDGLTGTHNRRHFDRMLEREWQRAMRSQTTLALIMIDLDNFKAYNDTYGHMAGDACLKAVAGILMQIPCRASDMVFRYGGDEFACLLPDTDKTGALVVAEQMLKQVRNMDSPAPAGHFPVRVTLSLGAAAVTPEMGTTGQELVDLADKALYMAKAKGRNQVQ